MAIRRPSISSPTWVFQDFLYADNPPEQLRYLQVKWDGAVFRRVSSTFDYSNPPYPDDEQRGGSIVAQLDYTINGNLITIDSWSVNWEDEWPLRLAINYLINCLYSRGAEYIIRVAKTNIDIAFWQSENFKPLEPEYNFFSLYPEVENSPQAYLVYFS